MWSVGRSVACIEEYGVCGGVWCVLRGVVCWRGVAYREVCGVYGGVWRVGRSVVFMEECLV